MRWKKWILFGFLVLAGVCGAIGGAAAIWSKKASAPPADDGQTPVPGAPTICSFEAAPRSGEAPLWVEFLAEVKSSERDAWPMKAVFHFYDDTSHVEGIAAPPEKKDAHCALIKVKHKYKGAGDYEAILEVTDAKGRKAAEAKVIVVVSHKAEAPPLEEKYEADPTPIPLLAEVSKGLPAVIEVPLTAPVGEWSSVFVLPADVLFRRRIEPDQDYEVQDTFTGRRFKRLKGQETAQRGMSASRYFQVRVSEPNSRLIVYLTR